jgi:CheY-like chemotaxis protein
MGIEPTSEAWEAKAYLTKSLERRHSSAPASPSPVFRINRQKPHRSSHLCAKYMIRCIPFIDLSCSACLERLKDQRVIPKTILLADDSPLIGQALYRLLATEENYDLRVQAADGKSAISLAQECKPDLVILDLSMPKMNGLQTARELKKIMPSVPIILFTLHADAVDESVARDWCVDSVVLKGDFKRLISDVRRLLSDESREAASPASRQQE